MGEDTDTRKINHSFLRDHSYVTEGNVRVVGGPLRPAAAWGCRRTECPPKVWTARCVSCPPAPGPGGREPRATRALLRAAPRPGGVPNGPWPSA